MRMFLLVLAIALSLPAGAQSTKVHWYGQAAFRIETPSGGVILIDPRQVVPMHFGTYAILTGTPA